MEGPRARFLLLLAGCNFGGSPAAVGLPWGPEDSEEVLGAVAAMPECTRIRQGVEVVWIGGRLRCGATASTTGCAYPFAQPPRVEVVDQGSAWSGPATSGRMVSSLAHELCHVCGYLDELEADACASRASMISKQSPDLTRWQGSQPGPDGAPVSGRWILTGAMNEPRSQHVLTLLADGRVLAAGGCNQYSDEYMGCRALKSAELYDPVTGAWTPTAPMIEERRNFGAVLLRDGRVLVAGGCDGSQLCCKRSAELFDPAADRWTQTGPMNWPRGYTSTVVLPGGDVLAVGGNVACSAEAEWPLCGTAAAEVYHPESNSWTEGAPLGRPVLGNTLTLTGPGAVLLTNGFSRSRASLGGGMIPSTCGRGGGMSPAPSALGSYLLGAEQAEAELYQPSAGQWSRAPSMRFPRLIQSATSLRSGRVLVVGGNWIGCERAASGDSLGCSPYMAPQGEIYDPWHDAWTLTPALPHYVLGSGAAVLLQSGDVLFAGGVVNSPFFLYELTIGAAQLYREEAPPAEGARPELRPNRR